MTVEEVIARVERGTAEINAAIVDLLDVRDEMGTLPGPRWLAPEPAWLVAARAELGVKEVAGKKHNPRILEYLATVGEPEGGNLKRWGRTRDETAWCSAFLNWLMLLYKIKGTRSAAARSWLKWGVECSLRPGAIMVLSRVGGGHVGLLTRADADGVWLLGGNQGDEVSIKRYPYRRLLACRWPAGAPQ